MPYVTSVSSPEQRIKVPDTEYCILTILMQREVGLPAPSIAKASNGEISVDSVYTLLKRMVKRGVLNKVEQEITVEDIASFKRVVYTVKEGVTLAG